MSEETWTNFGSTLEAMRQMLAKQDNRIRELLAENAVSKLATSDAQTRLENIRFSRREEIRERIEGQIEELIMPGDSKFKMPNNRKN
jgi:DNA-binding TFAR19-related protein (PDSD5 family)